MLNVFYKRNNNFPSRRHLRSFCLASRTPMHLNLGRLDVVQYVVADVIGQGANKNKGRP